MPTSAVTANAVDASCHDSHDNATEQMIMIKARKQRQKLCRNILMNINYIIMRTTSMMLLLLANQQLEID